jgi:hypothetical protein
MADVAIADFDARINLFDSAFPVRRAHARGGLPRHVPGRDHQRPIVPRSQELLSRERKATMGRWRALRILPCLLEVLSRERKATMGRWHSSMIVPRSLRRSDSRVWWAEIGRDAAGALRHKVWAVLSLRSDGVNSVPAEESGDSRSLPCHFVPLFVRRWQRGNHPEFAIPSRGSGSDKHANLRPIAPTAGDVVFLVSRRVGGFAKLKCDGSGNTERSMKR